MAVIFSHRTEEESARMDEWDGRWGDGRIMNLWKDGWRDRSKDGGTVA